MTSPFRYKDITTRRMLLRRSKSSSALSASSLRGMSAPSPRSVVVYPLCDNSTPPLAKRALFHETASYSGGWAATATTINSSWDDEDDGADEALHELQQIRSGGGQSLRHTEIPAPTLNQCARTTTIPVEPPPGRIQVAVRLCPHQSQQYRLSPKRRSRNHVSSNSSRSSSIQQPQQHPLVEDAGAWIIEPAAAAAADQPAGITKTTMRLKSSKQSQKCYQVDAVFDEAADTSHVYEQFCAPIVQQVVHGQHGTIFCYGRTGSGKTHTMQGTTHEAGVIAQAVADLLRHSHAEQLRCQYFEIYNEQVRDLLADLGAPLPNATTTSKVHDNAVTMSPTLLSIIDDGNGTVMVNAKEVHITSLVDVARILQNGNRQRASATTDQNHQSSRSHAIFKLFVQFRGSGSADAATATHRTQSTLHLVDLAGSEKGPSSGSVGGGGGARLREGSKINQSLLALGRVIHALSLPEKKRPRHINYRDSKLTRLLQPSLSGRSCTAILCCASTSRAYLEETRSTLKFAANAQRIAIHPTVQASCSADRPQSDVIATLQKELAEAKVSLRNLQEHQRDNHQGALGMVSAVSCHAENIHQHAHVGLEERSISASHLAGGAFPVDSVCSDTNGSASSDEESDDDDTTSILTSSYLSSIAYLDHKDVHDSAKQLEPQDAAGCDQIHEYKPPISEVVVLSEALTVDSGIEHDNETLLHQSQQREAFFRNKLDSADHLMDRLFKDMKRAGRCQHELHASNDRLRERIRELEELEYASAEHNTLLMQQHLLLKYAVYMGLILYISGQRDLFLATTLLLWLLLEIWT